MQTVLQRFFFEILDRDEFCFPQPDFDFDTWKSAFCNKEYQLQKYPYHRQSVLELQQERTDQQIAADHK